MSPEHKNNFFDAFLVSLSSCNICLPYYLPCRSLSSLRKLFLSGQTILPRVHSPQWLQTFHGFFITALRERAVLVSIKNTRILLPPSQLRNWGLMSGNKPMLLSHQRCTLLHFHPSLFSSESLRYCLGLSVLCFKAWLTSCITHSLLEGIPGK